MRRAWSIVGLGAVVLLVAACFGGTVRDVATLKDLVAARDLEAIVAYDVACAAAEPGCAQAHMIKADACLRRAQGVAVMARAPYAACAAEGYAAARVAAAARSDPLVDPARLARWELESLRFWRDAVSRDAASTLNATLAERAEAVATTQPARPEGPYYLADARVWPVNAGLERPACPGISAASALADRAADRAAAGEVDVAQLQRDLANAARAHDCGLAS